MLNKELTHTTKHQISPSWPIRSNTLLQKESEQVQLAAHKSAVHSHTLASGKDEGSDLQLLNKDEGIAGLLVHGAVLGQCSLTTITTHTLHHHLKTLHHLGMGEGSVELQQWVNCA